MAKRSSLTAKLFNDTGSSSTDNITSNDALTGTASGGARITFTLAGGASIGQTTASKSGQWTFTPAGPSDGTYTIVVGEPSASKSTTLTFTLDTKSPTVTESLASDTGVSSTDRITANPSLIGTSDPNAVVTLKEGTTTIGTVKANTTGSWAFNPSLSQGTHTIAATETDLAGNVGSISLAFTLDSLAPSATERLVSDTGASASDKITSKPALTGTGDPNATVTLSEGTTVLGTTTADNTGNWSFTPTGLGQGPHTIVATETDLAGNTGSAPLSFTLDSNPPIVTEALADDTGTPGDNITSDPALKGTGEPNATMTLQEGPTVLGTARADAAGNWGFTPAGLSQGPHTIVASETDLAGNTGSTSLTFTLQGGSTTGVPAYDHIVVVMEENHDYSQIIGNSAAPYINSLASTGALLTNYSAISHPSEPNYFALYAGSTFGISDDNHYSEPDPTLATILQGAGKTFIGYVEHPNESYDHNPWESFPERLSVEQDFGTTFPSGNFFSLPTVSFVIPNVDDNMHNGTIAQGDAWLQSNIDAYAQWAKANNSLLIVAWDENDGSNDGNHVAAILSGAHVNTGTNGTAYNHYDMLSTILASYGLTGPNNAATAPPIAVFDPPPAGGATVSAATAGSAGTASTASTSDTFTLTGNNAALVLQGSNNTVFLNGATSATINDDPSGQDHLRLIVEPTGGNLSISNFGALAGATVDLPSDFAGFTSAAQVVSALTSDQHGGTLLSFGGQGSIDFLGIAPGGFSTSNFHVG